MKGFLIVLSVVYSAQAWQEVLGPLHIVTGTGKVPQKYELLTADDKHATRKAGTLVSFIKNLPQLNPFVFSSLGPYPVNIADVNFHGKVILSNVVVKGIRSLTLSGLEIRMDPSRIDFNASLPQVSADVNFAFSGELENKPLNVNGHVQANLHNVRAKVAVGPTITRHGQKEVYEVNNADVIIDLSEIEIVMQMDQHAEKFKGILLEFLNNINKYDVIVGDILRTVLKAISLELQQITAQEILQYLLGTSKPSSLL